MAISRERKEKLLEQYKDWIQQSRAIFLAEYSGISVKELEALRSEVRKAEGVFSVTKNTLLNLALSENDVDIPDNLLKKQLASSFALGEVPTLAKALVNYAKDEEKFILHGGIMGQEVLTREQVESLAKLPSLDELRAQLLGVLSAPARDIAGTVAAGMRQVVNVLDAYAKKDADVVEEAVAA